MKALLLTLTLFAASAQAAEVTTGKQMLAHSYLAGYCGALKDLSAVQKELGVTDGNEIFGALIYGMKTISSTEDLIAECNESIKKYNQFNEWADEGVQEF